MTEDSNASNTPRVGGLVALGQWCGYVLFRVVERLLGLFPLRFCSRVGAVGGVVFFVVGWRYRRLVDHNLRIAFGNEMNERERRRLRWKHAARLGANLACSLRFGTMSPEEIAGCVEVVKPEELEDVHEAGRGVVFIVLHQGPWELLAQTDVFLPKGAKGAAVYQPLANRWLDRHVLKLRTRTGRKLLNRNEGFAGGVAWLREGGCLGVLADQHAGDAGVFAPYFGRLASTTPLPLLLARRSGAALCLIGVSSVGPGRWRMEVEMLPDDAGRNAQGSGLLAMNAAVERAVRLSPEDAFWVHNRWKTPTPAFLLRQRKRGWVLPENGVAGRFAVLVRSPNWLGDACMAVPAVRAIKAGRPDLYLVVLAPGKLAEFWRAVPGVDGVIAREGGEGVARVAAKIRAAGPWDAGILFPNSVRSVLEMRWGGVPHVVGYGGRGRSWLLHQEVPRKEVAGWPPHHIESYLQIAHRIGADCGDALLFEPLPGRKDHRGEGAAAKVRIGVCFGAEYGPAKRWPLERFAEAARQVTEGAGRDVVWVLVGVAGEREDSQRLEEAMSGLEVENLVGRTSLSELIDVLRGCDLLLSNDTGTMHLAALLGVPVVAVFGSTEPTWTRPMGRQHVIVREKVECSPCFLRECPLDFRCMNSITSERVAGAVLGLVGGVGEERG